MRVERRRIGWLFCLIAIALAGLASAGCGASTKTSPARAISNTSSGYIADYDADDYNNRLSDDDNDDIKGPKDRDNDADNNTGSYYDSDEKGIRDFGEAAHPATRQIVTELVKRYFTVAAAEEGRKACLLLSSTLAKSVPQQYGQPPGPAYLRGKTCPEVMDKLFARDHKQLSAYSGNLEVTGVRLANNHGLAVLRFERLPGREIELKREHHLWRIDGLLDRELP